MYVDIKTNNELHDVAKLFYGDDCPDIFLSVNGDTDFSVSVGGNCYAFKFDADFYNVIPISHRVPRLSKIAVYDALRAYTGKIMPWGALTGVRPTKLFYECMKYGNGFDESVSLMQNIYRVSDMRADVLRKIVKAQSGKVNFGDEYYNLYVHIPYCTTRCKYCSFVSAPIDKCKAQSVEYVKLLCDEIVKSVSLTSSYGKKILSVYIGGGTPTALDERALDTLLSAIDSGGGEYTCEAGRPDTVTEEKCRIMKAHGVNRVCVNPQTLNAETLQKIGRNHTVKQFYDVYDTVKSYDFDINCDLIAGLENETLNDFVASYNGITALRPQNITVHSLSKKNGSVLRYAKEENTETVAMLDYVLNNMGDYDPYYLYRQKRQSCNLENIGLTLPDKQCINNITTMEETVSVVACGAGAISKITGEGKISRFANVRDVNLYISEYSDRLKAKLDYLHGIFNKTV